ncbi:MAG: nuclease, partial [Deltaproteobacteria bacterium]|nr:nuclease [Deltaproteobacteria bacterium]
STQHHFEAVKWLEKVVKLLDVVQPAPKTHSEAWFSPGTDCADAILGAIASARHTIQVCVFTISDDRISHALLDAHHRNVRVRVITDDEKALDMGSDVHWLQKKGIPVKYDNDPGHMHHKFAVFDGQVVIHGSFNWTRSASTQNWEDISVQEDATLVTAFAQHFEYLWHTF